MYSRVNYAWAFLEAALPSHKSKGGFLVKNYAIFLLDPNGSFRRGIKPLKRIKGYRAKEIVGQRFSCFYPREAVESKWPDRNAGGRGFESRRSRQFVRPEHLEGEAGAVQRKCVPKLLEVGTASLGSSASDHELQAAARHSRCSHGRAHWRVKRAAPVPWKHESSPSQVALSEAKWLTTKVTPCPGLLNDLNGSVLNGHSPNSLLQSLCFFAGLGSNFKPCPKAHLVLNVSGPLPFTRSWLLRLSRASFTSSRASRVSARSGPVILLARIGYDKRRRTAPEINRQLSRS